MKSAIVIGGLSGIGKGIAKALTERGYKVVIGDINAANTSDKTYFIDANRPDSVSEFFSQVKGKIQHLDALVITTGVIDEGSVINVPSEKWKWIFNNNLFSSIYIVDAFLPLLEKSTEARIMLTGSGSGFRRIDANSSLGLYAISKHALLGYFKVLHDELAKKQIKVSLLVPSAIKGNLAENSAQIRHSMFNEELAIHIGQQPSGRILQDADAAGQKFVAEFLTGKVIITNNPSQLIKQCQEEFDDLIKALS